MSQEQQRLIQHQSQDNESTGSGKNILPKTTAHQQERSFWQKYRWWILGLAILGIIGLILGLTLRKDEPTPGPGPNPGPSPGPQPTPKPPIIVPGYNPYKVDDATIFDDEYSVKGYIIADETEIARQAHLHPLSGNNSIIKGNPQTIPPGVNNEMVKNVSFEFGKWDYRSAFLRLDDGLNPRFSVPSDVLNKPESVQQQKLEMVGFNLNKEKFEFDFKSHRDGKTYISTINQTFVMMDKYLQLDLNLPSRRIYGFGERSRQFTLGEGVFKMWSTRHYLYADQDIDTGRHGNGNYHGVHPFALIQTETKGEYMGVFFRNSNLMSPIITYNQTIDNKTDPYAQVLSLISIGGTMEIYFFFKGTAKQIIAQYQDLVGKPAMPPAWSLGWHIQGEWLQTQQLKAYAGNMTQNNLPWEVAWLTEATDIDDNFVLAPGFKDLPAAAAELKTQGLKMIPAINAHLVSEDFKDKYFNEALNSDALVKSSINPEYENGKLTNKRGFNKIVYPDFFGKSAKSVWQEGIDDFQQILPFDGVFVDRNAGLYGSCQGECPVNKTKVVTEGEINDEPIINMGWWSGFKDQSVKSTYFLPYVPGGWIGGNVLDWSTGSMNGTFPTGNYSVYDTHNLYGHISGKATYDALKNNSAFSDKLPFVISQGSYAGSGSYMAHQFDGKFYSTEENTNITFMRYRISNIMSNQMFGQQMSGPSVEATAYSQFQNLDKNFTRRYFQMAAFSPFAKFHDVAEHDFDFKNALFNLGEPYLTDIKKAMYERLSFIHLLYTCLFEAHDHANTCYDPLLLHYPEDDQVFGMDRTEDSVMVANSIMMSPSYKDEEGESFKVYYPTDKNGDWVNLRTFAATSTKDTNTFDVKGGNVDLQLRPGRIIPWVDNSQQTYKSAESVLNSQELNLVINRDARGTAQGTLYLGDGISRSQLEDKTYEYYQFRMGGKSIKKQIVNENRKDTGRGIKSVIITNAADIMDTDFACMTTEADHTVIPLNFNYNADLKLLTLSWSTGNIPTMVVKDIHFGKTGKDVNMCNLNSHFYEIDTIDKQAQLWRLNLKSATPQVAHELVLDISMFEGNIVNLKWTEKDHADEYFEVPDTILGIDRSKKRIDINENMIGLVNGTNNRLQVIIKNGLGDQLYALNGMVLTHDHFNFFDIEVKTDGKIMGLSDHVSDSLFLKDGVYGFWSRDIPTPVADGKLPTKNEYGSYPFLISTSNTMPSVGVFSNNVAAQDWWIKTDATKKVVSMRVFAAGGIGDHFIFTGGAQYTPQPVEIVKSFQKFIAQPLVPPQWALGWHQCRWGYNDTTKLRAVVQGYKDNELPLDAMWNDIDVMKDYRSFTVNKEFGFSDLGTFVDELHNQNIKYVPIADSALAVRPDKQYMPYFLANALGNLIKDYNGNTFVGMVWPNDAAWLDWFNEGSAHLWRGYIQELYEQVAFDGIWLDMNEASNFCFGACYADQDSPNQSQDTLIYHPTGRDLRDHSISLEAKHFNGWTELDVHSLFGHMSAQATSTWFELNQNNRRKMIISRSGGPGTTRFASRWQGDNQANEFYMGASVTGSMYQQMNGFTLTGADVCGFMGDTNPNLCARWYTVAAFQPFARNHNQLTTIAQEPYVFADDIYQSAITVLDVIRHSMQVRLNMIRYMYTSMVYGMHFEGSPYYQPLFFQFPTDANAYTADPQHNVMLGESLKLSHLARETGDDTYNFYFPAGTWCNVWQNLGDQGCFTSTGQNMTMPSKAYNAYVHLRDGHIVPLQNVTYLKSLYSEKNFTSTADMQQQPVELHIHPKTDGTSAGKYYNDDGESDNNTPDNFRLYNFNTTIAGGVITLNVAMTHNTTASPDIINTNDVLGQVHIYNAKARGLSGSRYYQSEIKYVTGQTVKLLLAEYSAWVDRIILPPTYIYLTQVQSITLTPVA